MHGLNECTMYFFLFCFIKFIVNTHNSGTAANQTSDSELPLEYNNNNNNKKGDGNDYDYDNNNNNI